MARNTLFCNSSENEMDGYTMKAILDWAYKQGEQLKKLEGEVSSLTQAVHNISELDRSSYEDWKMFNGFIVSAIDGMKSVGRNADKNLVLGLASGGIVYANSIAGGGKFITTGKSNMKDNGNCNLYCGPHICEEKGSSSKSNIGKGLFDYFDDVVLENDNSGMVDTVIGDWNCEGKVVNRNLSLRTSVKGIEKGKIVDGVCSVFASEKNNEFNVGNVEEIELLSEKTNTVGNGKNSNHDIICWEIEKQCDNELKVEGNTFVPLDILKTGNSRKDRLVGKVFDFVCEDQEDEILMESGNVDVDAMEIINDISPAEVAKLENDVVPFEIIKLVYGDEICKAAYTITCEVPCNGVLDFFDVNEENPNSVAMKKFRSSILAYTMNSTLDSREIIVATELVIVRRSHILSLRADGLLDSRIVNAVVNLLWRHQMETSPNNLKYWWIPTNVTRPKRFRYDVMSDRSKWDPWVGPLSDCEKIYIPICAKRHWFLTVVDIKQQIALVYDDLKISSVPLGTAIVDTILKSLDIVFGDDIRELKGEVGMFNSFAILPPIDYKTCCKNYDCGINVIKRMQAASNGDKLCVHGTKDDERMVVALQLIMSAKNKMISSILNRSVSMNDSCSFI